MLNRDHYTLLIVPAEATARIRRFQINARWAGAALVAVGLAVLMNFVGVSGLLTGVWTSGERARLEAENAAYRDQVRRYQEMADSLSSQLSDIRSTEASLKKMVDYQEPKDSSSAPAASSASGGKGGKGGLERGDLSRVSPSIEAGLDLSTPLRGEDALYDAFARLQEEAGALQASLTRVNSHVQREQARSRARPSILPKKGPISSEYGHRVSPFTGMDQFHDGLDIEADIGDPVRATADGVVSFAGWSSGLGITVEIKHENGVMTRYGHNSVALVRPGQRVRQGDIISKAGMTGRTTGCHVHYEVLVKGRNVNPRKYLND